MSTNSRVVLHSAAFLCLLAGVCPGQTDKPKPTVQPARLPEKMPRIDAPVKPAEPARAPSNTPEADGPDEDDKTSYPKCKADHPGRTDRAITLTKNGDSKVAKSVAKHVVKYSVKRYDLADLVSESDIDRAEDQIYNYLKWKLGSPSAVAAQWLSAGYKHFDKNTVDEAAGVLLGIVEFKKKDPELLVPVWMQDYLKKTARDQSKAAVSQFLQARGVPAPLADAVGEKVSKEVEKTVGRNVVGVDLPKSYDIDNRLVAEAIKGRRDHEKAVREATRKASPRVGIPALPNATTPSKPVRTGTPK